MRKNPNPMTEIEIPSRSYIDYFKKTTGAFSVCEMIALSNICKQAPTEGMYMELGSHKGKSTVASIYGLKGSCGYVLVEPEFADTDWVNSTGASVMGAIRMIGSKVSLIYLADYSTNVIPHYKDYAYVFVDSGVHDDLVMEEVKMLEDKMVQGGIIAFHDYKNQFTAVERAYNYLLSTGKYESMPINWDLIFRHVREHKLEDGNDSWHESGSEEFPKFVGALKRK